METQKFNFNLFIEESKMAIVNPKEFFSSLTSDGGIGPSVIRALLYGTFSGIISLVWSIFHIGGATGLGAIIGSGLGIMAFIGSVIGSVIGLFIGGVIMLILSAIAGGNTDFEANIKVTSYLMVLMPIQAVLGFLSGINYFLGSITDLIVNAYGIWMLYHALITPLGGKQSTVKVIAIVLIVFYGLGFIVKLGTHKVVNNYSAIIESQLSGGGDLEESMEQAKQLAEKIGGHEAAQAVEDAYNAASDGSNNFSIESANGDVIDSPSLIQLQKSISELNGDNDYLILSNGDDFIQIAYSDNGYTIEYKENGVMYSSSGFATEDEAIGIFIAYFSGVNTWKEMSEWEQE